MAVKSVRTDPRNHAAEGDERIRTAELSLGADPVYDNPADAYSRRVAHATHALMEVRNDPSIGPYGPFKASEIVLYDPEALTARHTARALREAQRHGLAIYCGNGYWTASNFALDNVRHFEDRYLRDTDAEQSDA